MSQNPTSEPNPDDTINPAPRLPIDSDKPACDLAFFSAANNFAESAIQHTPELHGVAIVPIWTPQLQNVPHGLLRLRNETPPYIASLLQLLVNLSMFAGDVHRDMAGQFRAFDQMARDLAEEVKNQSSALQQIMNAGEEKSEVKAPNE